MCGCLSRRSAPVSAAYRTLARASAVPDCRGRTDGSIREIARSGGDAERLGCVHCVLVTGRYYMAFGLFRRAAQHRAAAGTAPETPALPTPPAAAHPVADPAPRLTLVAFLAQRLAAADRVRQ